MAIEKTMTLESGITINNAYIKIDSITGNKNNCSLTVGIAVSKDLADNNNYVLSKIYSSFVPSVSEGSENFIKQGYEYLKTLDEYKDAVGC